MTTKAGIKIRKLTGLPEFMKGVKVLDTEMPQFIEELSNWPSMLYHSNAADEAKILKMIFVELATKYRWRIIERLKSRFNTLRKDREKLELIEWMNGQ